MKYLLLDGFGDNGWNAASIEGLEAKRSSLRLAPLPVAAAPLLDSVPPPNAVAPNGDVYSSDSITHRIFRMRFCGTESFGEYLPGIGGEGSAPRKLRAPRGLAIHDWKLYVADSGNDRIQIFDLGTLKLLAIRRGFRSPSDVAIDAKGNVWVADRGNACIRRNRGPAIDGTAVAAHFFEVNYGPDARQRFVFIPLRGRLELWRNGTPVIVAQNVATVSDASAKLADLLHARGARRLFLEWDAVYPLESGEPFLEPSDLGVWNGHSCLFPRHRQECLCHTEGLIYVVDRQKDYVRVLDTEGRLLRIARTWDEVAHAFQPAAASAVTAAAGFAKSGSYVSRAFDSGIDRCAWDRIDVAFGGGVPATTAATISTFTSNEALTDADAAALDDEQWRKANANATDFLVLSPPGRYLWLRIAFSGDGAATPLIERIRLFQPRASYLQYLPAVYQADAVSRDLLDRFLRIFQTIFESFEARIDDFADFLDPDGTPSNFVEWLAGWIAMTFDPTMEEAVRRNLLRHAPELYRMRGTPAGIRRFLELAFGIDAQILEHFRLRKWTFLGSGAALGTRTQLWGRAITPRLQLDVFSRIGETALISTGDPLHDPFAVHAHKFSVFVPAPVLRSSSTVAAVRTLIEREKPAHVQYALVGIEPRFRLGVQSTLGLDSVVGSYPCTVLCETNLGFDTLLGQALPPVRREYGQRLRMS